MKRSILTYILLSVSFCAAKAQEYLAPLLYRPATQKKLTAIPNRSASKTTALSLPFFEDFSSGNFFPDTSKWLDKKIYINNNMGLNPVTMGVATFDAIDEDGLPYEKINSTLLIKADSLTSQQIDLSTYAPADSLYLSFFYQPQGRGFEPQPQDSLMLYLRKTGEWARVWRTTGGFVKPFEQVMIPITDSSYFHDGFQFRFINKASLSNADDIWNVDYIRLEANRNINDTGMNDVAFVREPSFILKNYTHMPYHQYLANAANERANQHSTSIINLNASSTNVNYGYTAREVSTNTSLGSGTGSIGISNNEEKLASFPVYTNTTPAPPQNDHVVFENKYWIQSGANTGTVANDTIIRKQVFHNYYAYDDGTAEKSYYLKLYPTLPGKLAIEYNLTNPDTLKGVAIYFGRQVPLAYHKFFSLTVHQDIAINGGSEKLLLQEDFLVPAYLQQHQYYYYRFQNPVILPAGKFYIGTVQPALSSSDSLYFGFDEDMDASSKTYYSVLNQWKSSSISGSVMIRPLFGLVFPTGEHAPVQIIADELSIGPNPAKDHVFVYSLDEKATYSITDMLGRTLQHGVVQPSKKLDISALPSGAYFINIYGNKRQKLIKL